VPELGEGVGSELGGGLASLDCAVVEQGLVLGRKSFFVWVEQDGWWVVAAREVFDGSVGLLQHFVGDCDLG
jgi:hypothetical protein